MASAATVSRVWLQGRALASSTNAFNSVRTFSTSNKVASIPAHPYGGLKGGFKQIDGSTLEITPPPADMPHFPLNNGQQLPAIGMGTFTGTRNTAKAEGGTLYETTKMWLRSGGRLIDAASNYLNEDEIGDAMEECINEGWITRDEIFISSKLNNPYHRPEHVRPMLEKSLMDLKVDQVDMYLMHWPTAFKYVPYDPTMRGFPLDYEPDCCTKVTGVQWDPVEFAKDWPPPHLDMGVTIHDTWEAMAECVDLGLTKGVGVCNFKVTLLHELLCGTDHVPSIVQSESHPYCQQTDLIKFCKMNGIQYQGYSPLGYGEFKSADEMSVLENPVIAEIGAKHGKSSASVVLRWHVQRGVGVPPFSLKENELRENLTVGSWALDDEDMEQIATLDKEFHYLRPDAWYGLPLWS